MGWRRQSRNPTVRGIGYEQRDQRSRPLPAAWGQRFRSWVPSIVTPWGGPSPSGFSACRISMTSDGTCHLPALSRIAAPTIRSTCPRWLGAQDLPPARPCSALWSWLVVACTCVGSGRAPCGVRVLTTSGRTAATPWLTWSGGSPDAAASCASCSGLSSCSTWAAVMGWLAPVPTHDDAVSPIPLACMVSTSWCRPD